MRRAKDWKRGDEGTVLARGEHVAGAKPRHGDEKSPYPLSSRMNSFPAKAASGTSRNNAFSDAAMGVWKTGGVPPGARH